jgi:hypothetical protein
VTLLWGDVALLSPAMRSTQDWLKGQKEVSNFVDNLVFVLFFYRQNRVTVRGFVRFL